MKQLLIPAALVFALGACSQSPQEPAADAAVEPAAVEAPAPAAVQVSELDAVIAGEHRSEENRARDRYRHPTETLAFFGFAPIQTVVEITPGGGGWYAEILSPALSGSGQYIGVVVDPAKASSEGATSYYTEQNQKLRDKFAANPELYGRAQLVEIDPAAPSLGAPASADLVVTFRNVHNWMGADKAEGMFHAFHEVLKPGGVLGVVEHRAAEGAENKPESGYVAESKVIELATAAGFELAAKSEINANPADTKDHANGVWTLPPSRRTPEGEDAAKYEAIGESDRMTLKFVKPAAAAADVPPPAAGTPAAADAGADGDNG